MSTSPFRFDKVHHVRQNLREQRRLELLDAQRAEDEVASQISALKSELQTLKSQTNSAVRPGPLNIDQLRHALRYEHSLLGELQSAQNRRQSYAAEVARRRQALVEADREVKVIDRLQERQRVQLRIDQARRDAKLRDDQNVVASYRRRDS